MRPIVGLVAQICNLLYRRFLTCWRKPIRRVADYKSAIQQIENLRYP